MKRFDKPILVTRPYFPDIEEFKRGVEEIWENQWLTNNGPILQRFEKRLAEYLRVPVENLAIFNNDTLALELGYYAKGTCPIAEDIASRVLTLPTYYGLTTEDATTIAENVKGMV